MIAGWGVSWLLESVLAPGKRAIFVTDVTEADLALPNHEPPHVQGMSYMRLGPGVFGYKNGSTLQVWPADRHIRNVPNISAPFGVVLDPGLIPFAATAPLSGSAPLAPTAMAVTFVVRWGLNEVSTQEMGMSCYARAGIKGTDFVMASRVKISVQALHEKNTHYMTMPYVCGNALGQLLQSKAGQWLVSPAPATVKLCDSLGRVVTMDDVMPTPEIVAMGKKFRLRVENTAEIQFTEIHG